MSTYFQLFIIASKFKSQKTIKQHIFQNQLLMTQKKKHMDFYILAKIEGIIIYSLQQIKFDLL